MISQKKEVENVIIILSTTYSQQCKCTNLLIERKKENKCSCYIEPNLYNTHLPRLIEWLKWQCLLYGNHGRCRFQFDVFGDDESEMTVNPPQ